MPVKTSGAQGPGSQISAENFKALSCDFKAHKDPTCLLAQPGDLMFLRQLPHINSQTEQANSTDCSQHPPLVLASSWCTEEGLWCNPLLRPASSLQWHSLHGVPAGEEWGGRQQGLQARPVLWLYAVFDREAEQPSALPESWKQSLGAHLRGSASGHLATQLHFAEEPGSSVSSPKCLCHPDRWSTWWGWWPGTEGRPLGNHPLSHLSMQIFP